VQVSETTALPLWQQPWFIGTVVGVIVVVIVVAILLMRKKAPAPT